MTPCQQRAKKSWWKLLVLVPDLNAGYSLADSCPADEFAAFVAAHLNHQVISYVMLILWQLSKLILML